MLDSAFSQIALILIAAAVVGMFAKFAKQPLIVAYIFVGILLGPATLNLVSSQSEIELLGKLGIGILLFLVGLKLDVGLIRSTGLVALLTGIGQVAFTAAFGYLLGLAFGFDSLGAIYVALALTFSSTIIVVKLLSDKRELDQLHGQIAIGFLIVQDILVIVAMLAIVSIGSPQTQSTSEDLAIVVVSSLSFLIIVGLLAKFVIPKLLQWLARSQELTLLFGVGWAISLAAISDLLGLSMEIGAFVAGVALAATPYRESLSGRMVSLRDIMILFFFVQLGSALSFDEAYSQLLPALVLSIFVLVGKPLIVLAIMGGLGYRNQVSFKTGIAVAQISEFSLILIALGYSLGQVDQSVLSLVTLVGIITITISTYFILYSEQLYRFSARWLAIFERKDSYSKVEQRAMTVRYDAIIVGAGRLGSGVISGLRKKGATLLVVDQNPRALQQASDRGALTLYGDISDPDFAVSLPLHEADAVICAVHDRATNISLLETLERFDFEGQICLTAMDEPTAKLLKENKKVKVIKPLKMAASRIVDALPEPRNRAN